MKAPYTVVHLLNGETIESPIHHTFTDLQIEDWKNNMLKVLASEDGTVTVDNEDRRCVMLAKNVMYVELVLADPPF